MSRPGIEPLTSRSTERTLYQMSCRGWYMFLWRHKQNYPLIITKYPSVSASFAHYSMGKNHIYFLIVTAVSFSVIRIFRIFMVTFQVVKDVVLVFYGPSTHLRSFRVQSVNLATLFLGKPSKQFTSTLCPFFRQ